MRLVVGKGLVHRGHDLVLDLVFIQLLFDLHVLFLDLGQVLMNL